MDRRVRQPMKGEREASSWLGSQRRQTPNYHGTADDLDHALNAWLGRWSANVSPASLWMAYFDWCVHLQLSPSKQHQLLQEAWKKCLQLQFLQLHVSDADPDVEAIKVRPLPQDKRFVDPTWQQWPFNVLSQGFLMSQQWWQRATSGVHGVSRHHEQVATFIARQILDVFSPSNFLLTNPVALNETVRTGGMNLVRGAMNELGDLRQHLSGRPPHPGSFRVGESVAITPGKVVYRNHLIELIQYAPSTPQVHAVPLLFVPAWIMKYYILDLSPENSLVRYLVGQGYTVFMISWKNPDASDRELSMEDYRKLGVMDAIDEVLAITGSDRLNAVGYCLGGTLLSIAAAAMARDGDERLASLTLFASQVDFKEPGELSLFIDESQLAQLEASMWQQGYLDTRQMAGAFQLLRSNDLIWSRRLNQYVLGQKEIQNDLAAWNADATRMPFRMHSEYLRQLFLGNDLAEGRFEVEGRTIDLTDISAPIFSVGTLTDHVAPWRSVFKIHHLTDTDVTFLLTSGGHNAGVVSPPGQPRRSYQIATRHHDARHIDPDVWEVDTPMHEGSWWPAWAAWLSTHSGELVAPPAREEPICDAPGTYVLVP